MVNHSLNGTQGFPLIGTYENTTISSCLDGTLTGNLTTSMLFVITPLIQRMGSPRKVITVYHRKTCFDVQLITTLVRFKT